MFGILSARGANRAFRLVVAMMALLLTTAVASAAAATVSGTVTTVVGGTPQPVDNVAVEVRDAGLPSVVGTATANPTGEYSVVVAPGTYDFSFTPPSGTGLGVTTANSVAVTGDRTLNVELVPTPVHLTGHLTTGNGAPVGGTPIMLYSAGGSAQTAVTDATGFYEFYATPG
ncbi:MAG: hypothetical protein HY827_00005, partial [Actinobacteria bacterium]|nr:hypothetical protein [Actinomycetota bacterium]